jgi:hypothetical protein
MIRNQANQRFEADAPKQRAAQAIRYAEKGKRQ